MTFVTVHSLNGPENHFAERLFRTMSPTNSEFVNLLVVRSEVGSFPDRCTCINIHCSEKEHGCKNY